MHRLLHDDRRLEGQTRVARRRTHLQAVMVGQTDLGDEAVELLINCDNHTFQIEWPEAAMAAVVSGDLGDGEQLAMFVSAAVLAQGLLAAFTGASLAALATAFERVRIDPGRFARQVGQGGGRASSTTAAPGRTRSERGHCADAIRAPSAIASAWAQTRSTPLGTGMRALVSTFPSASAASTARWSRSVLPFRSATTWSSV
jgi:hypothetical protein